MSCRYLRDFASKIKNLYKVHKLTAALPPEIYAPFALVTNDTQKKDVKIITIYKIKYNFLKKRSCILLHSLYCLAIIKTQKVVKNNKTVRLGCRL